VVDRELVLRKAALLEQYVNELEDCRFVTLEAYLGDLKTQRFVERTLHLAIEACLDLAEHVIADRRLRVPASHAETFEILREAGFVADPLADSLIRMARFRNVLVHDYARIDAPRVVRILQENLADLIAFKQLVVQSV
jgi:uncharacterized protein YutE (UPF0331/DUF86 family)